MGCDVICTKVFTLSVCIALVSNWQRAVALFFIYVIWESLCHKKTDSWRMNDQGYHLFCLLAFIDFTSIYIFTASNLRLANVSLSKGVIQSAI